MNLSAVIAPHHKDVGDDFTECLREDTLVDVLDSVVDILLRCRNTTLHVPLVAHNRSEF